jgi:hypothetical protein
VACNKNGVRPNFCEFTLDDRAACEALCANDATCMAYEFYGTTTKYCLLTGDVMASCPSGMTFTPEGGTFPTNPADLNPQASSFSMSCTIKAAPTVEPTAAPTVVPPCTETPPSAAAVGSKLKMEAAAGARTVSIDLLDDGI